MAFWGEGNVGGGWQGIMGRKKRPWQSYVMPPNAKASMTQGTQAAMAGASGGGGMNRVLKHLGAMESPELDWSLAAQKVGVTSPWSPTNVPYSPVAGLMGFDPEKKKRYA